MWRIRVICKGSELASVAKMIVFLSYGIGAVAEIGNISLN